MRYLAVLLIVISAFTALAGCGSKSTDSAAAQQGAASTSAPNASKYDAGPRAGDQAADEALAKVGEQLFKDKGCSACHAFGTKLSGPDLAGVSMRRTALWMENQILHPEVMTKEDPISRELMGKYALQMPNQRLTAEQARSVIEYLKHRDHESSEEASEHGTEKKGDAR